MADYTLKQHDTYPPLIAELRDTNGPIDLTNSDRVKMIFKSDRIVVRTGDLEVDDPATLGRVIYEWQTGDTDEAGTYRLEFEITWAAGGIETVPNDSYIELEIVEDLG